MVEFHGHVSLPARVVHVDKISDIGSNWQLQRLFVGIYIYTYTYRLHIYIHNIYICYIMCTIIYICYVCKKNEKNA